MKTVKDWEAEIRYWQRKIDEAKEQIEYANKNKDVLEESIRQYRQTR